MNSRHIMAQMFQVIKALNNLIFLSFYASNCVSLDEISIMVDALKDSSVEQLSLKMASKPNMNDFRVLGPSGLRKIQLQWPVRDANSQAHLLRFLAPSLITLVDLDVTGCDWDAFLDFRDHRRSVFPAMRSFRNRTYHRSLAAIGAYAQMFPNLHSFDLAYVSVEPDYVQWTVSHLRVC